VITFLLIHVFDPWLSKFPEFVEYTAAVIFEFKANQPHSLAAGNNLDNKPPGMDAHAVIKG
jgi:hypothetical protein